MDIVFISAVVALVFDTNRRILLIKRKHQPFEGLWGLPGGHIEKGEHIDQAVIREVYEETGLQTKFARLWGVVSELVVERSQISRHHLLHICMLEPLHIEIPEEMRQRTKWFFKTTELKRAPWLIPSDALIISEASLTSRGGYYNCVLEVADEGIKIVEFSQRG